MGWYCDECNLDKMNDFICFSGYGYVLSYCDKCCPGFHDGSPCFREEHALQDAG